MPDRETARVSLIQELRLRRWARQHYVPPEQRDDTWHPVVLEEMRHKDAELLQQAAPPIDGTRYVPLAPGRRPALRPEPDRTPSSPEPAVARGPHFSEQTSGIPHGANRGL